MILWFLVVKLKLSLLKCYSCHNDVVNRYGISVAICGKWPGIWSVCGNRNPVLSSVMAYHQVCNESNMSTTIGADTVDPSGSPAFTLRFCSGGRVVLSLVFFVVFCRSLCVLVSYVKCCINVKSSEAPIVCVLNLYMYLYYHF